MMLNNILHQIDLIIQRILNMMTVGISQLILGIKDLILLIEIGNKWKIMTWKINNLKNNHKNKGDMNSNPEMKPGQNHIRIEKGKINMMILIRRIKDKEAIVIQN
jgi:hypothetical protein